MLLPIEECSAASSKTISAVISEKGIYDENDGIICCAENNGSLAVISAESNSFVFTVYGTEDEITDTLSFPLGGKNTYIISYAVYDGEFCAVFSTNGVSEYFCLINDTFTPAAGPAIDAVPVAEYRNGRITPLVEPSEIYRTLNESKLSDIVGIRLPDAELDAAEQRELMTLITACADLMEYERGVSDESELIRHVLYTHKNFRLLTDLPDSASDSGGGLKLCSGRFIDNVVWDAFRLMPEHPPVNMLTELGYCYNNGFYYYRGGYNTYFSTDEIELVRVFNLSDGSFYVIFSDKYTEGDAPPLFEYSTAVAERDESGFYLTALDMGGDISPPYGEPETEPKPSVYAYALPAAAAAAASAGAFVVIKRLRKR